MFKIILPADRAVPNMVAVARAFGIDINDLEDAIRIGTISRWVELGEGDEDNKPHQIFASSSLGIRVDVDDDGNVRSVSEYGAVNRAPRIHRPEYADTPRGDDRMEDAVDHDTQQKPESARKARLDALLDEALDESFPASDPVAISVEPPAQISRPLPKPEGE